MCSIIDILLYSMSRLIDQWSPLPSAVSCTGSWTGLPGIDYRCKAELFSQWKNTNQETKSEYNCTR